MHGNPSIGYIKKDGVLLEDKEQSPKIRHIFEKYIELRSVSKLHDYLIENEIRTKTDKMFYKGHLHKILRNKIYIGKITHKSEVYEGLHDGIVDEKVFEKVQNILDENTIRQKHSIGAKHVSLLAGKIYDDKDNVMSPSHSRNRHGACYRYYISQALLQNRQHEAGNISKIPAKEIEDFIRLKCSELVKNKDQMIKYLSDMTLKKQKAILNFLENYNPDNVFIRTVLNKVVVSENKVHIYLYNDLLRKALEALTYGQLLNFETEDNCLLEFNYEVNLSPCHQKGTKIVIGHNKIEYNFTLIRAITKGFYYHKLLKEEKLSKELRTDSYIKRLMRLRFLPPNIIEAILNGTQERGLTLKELYKIAKI
ncbi:MAG: recombinase family protein [Candidatus Gastranaerophilales bacterium]|nr:recombinase family protein [Candidatus Gastranaerophilales bacterium]